MTYTFPGSQTKNFYTPTKAQSRKQHVIVFQFNNDKTAITQVFKSYTSAFLSKEEALVETETQYGWHVKHTYILPLSELHHAFPIFEGKTETERMKMLGGYAESNKPKKKAKKENLPFGL